MKTQVLIVDDDPIILSLLSLSLSSHFDVMTAQDAETVVQWLNEQLSLPSVVVLDMGLPPMPYTPEIGLGLLAQLINQKPQIKVIVLTGQAHDEVAFKALSLGAFDFIAKPAMPETLIAAVNRAALFLKQQAADTAQGIHSIHFSVSEDAGLKQVRNEAEKRLFMQVWQQTSENVHETARRLGIKRENVYYLMDKFGVSRADS